MAEFADSAVGNEGQDTATDFQVEATDGGSVSLPDGFSLSDATFETDGSDLLLTGADGAQVTVEDFFAQDNPPELVSADGAQISGDMVTQLAGGPGDDVSAGTDGAAPGAGDGMLADNPSIISGTDGEPIGNVENLSGSVFAVRTDGTRVELKEGDSVFQGDILESGDDGAVGILLADETTFSMGENGRIVLDEMVYDPATQEGSVGLSIVQGVFTFVSGQVAKTDPDAMTLDTPVATIGIRGTQVGIDVDPQGGGMNVVLMEEADGFVGEVVIGNAAGVIVMNGANQTTSVANFSTAPTEIRVMDMRELIQSFGSALKQLPKVGGNQNDFGTQDEGEGEGEGEGEEEDALDEEIEELEEGELTDEELAELETEAGEEEGEGDVEGDEGDDILAGDDLDDELDDDLGLLDLGIEPEPEPDEPEGPVGPTGPSQADLDAARRAAELAARQAAAAAEARAAASVARVAANEAADLSDKAQSLAEQATAREAEVTELGQFAVNAAGTDSGALATYNLYLDQVADLVAEAEAAAAAAAAAEAAALVAEAKAGSAIGPAAIPARDAAIAARDEALIARLAAEAAAETADDLMTTVLLGDGDGSIQAALQDIADADWTGDIDGVVTDDIMDVGDLNVTGQIMDGGGGDDIIFARAGDDVLLGGTGNDILIGGEGNDILEGGDGNDVLIGGDLFFDDDTSVTGEYMANHTLRVDDQGNIFLVDGNGIETQVEQGASDIGADVLTGGGGDDILIGGGGNDVLTGGGGSDILIGGGGNDVLTGGGGTDTVVIDGTFANFTITKNTDGTITVASKSSGEVDILSGVEFIQFEDQILALVDNVPDAPTLDLESGIPGDQLVGEDTGDEDTAIALDISAELTDESETLSIRISGIPAGAVLILADGTEITPVNGEFTLTQEQLIDLSIRPPEDSNVDFDLTVTAISTVGGQSEETEGTLHIDVVGVADAPTLDVTVTSGVPGGFSSEPAADDPTPDDSSAHQIIGTDGDDVIEGRSREEFIDGGAGNDIITGSGGADVIVGGEGNDTIEGGGGADDIFGGTGDDILKGGRGADEIYGGAGDDTLVGGKGADILSGGAGDDFITGDAIDGSSDSQSDTVLFTGPRDQYFVTLNADGSFTVLDMFAGRDGTDTVIHVEDFQFADGAITEENLLATNPTTFIVDIDASLTDVDGSETLSFTISGLPEGAFLTFGTRNADGTWTFTAEDFATFEESGGTLGVIVPFDVSADFTLTVDATSTENDGDTNTVTQLIPLDGDPAAPTLDLDTVADGDQHTDTASGLEDTAIALDISADLVDPDGSETLSITIGGVPTGAVLASAGVALDANADGTYTLTADQLTDLTITPPEDFSGDFDLTVTVKATSDETASTTGVITVSVEPDADAPSLTVIDSSGSEDSEISLNPHIFADLTDIDGSETLSVTISGVPEGAVLSAGTFVTNADSTTTWTLTPEQLIGLKVTPPPDSDTDFTLTVTATSTDGTDTASTSGTIYVSVAPDADAPTLDLDSTASGDQTAGAASGAEDTAIALDINAGLTDGSETLSITISGVPAGAVLSAGTEDPVGSGNWVLTALQLENLTVTPPLNSDTDFTLTVMATSTDGTDTATTTGTIDVIVGAVADAPSLDLDSTASGDQLVGAASGTEDTAIPLDISAALADADGSETLSISIVVTGVPAGATLSAGTENADGTWTLTAQQLENLTVTPPADSDENFTLSVIAVATEANGDIATTTGTINVSVDPDADAPTLVLSSTAAGAEDTAIDLDISAALTDVDGSETLSVTITGVPAGAILSAGTEGPAGTWTLDPSKGDLNYLTVTPLANSDDDFTLSVIATSTDGTDTASTTGVINVSVAPDADAPTLDLNAGLTGDQDTGAAAGDAGDPISLDIASAVTDPSETLSITITGVPVGATLSAGTEGPAGTWTLDPAAGHLNNLTMTTALNFAGIVALAVIATSVDGSTQALASGTINVTVDPAVVADTTADGATLSSTGAAGLEDTAIDLNISAALTDIDGSETLSVTISGVPDGATLSAGVEGPAGTWTVAGADVADLTITPKEDSNVDFDLTVTATSTESDGGATATTDPVNLHVDVTGVADAPTVSATIGNVLSDSYQDTVLSHEPIAYWQMNETSGTTLVDTSGNHDGTYLKGAESESTVGGVGAGAGDFDGHNDHVDIPHSADMELSSGSITVWFNSDVVEHKQGLFSKDSSGIDMGGGLTAFVEDGMVKIRLQDGDGDSFWVDGGTLTDNSWSQITFNWGPGGMELYVDGQLVDTNTYTGGIENNDEPLVIGANSWSSDDGEANHLKDYFDGQIDEFSIMSEPLSAAEVSSLYNTGGQAILDNSGTVNGDVLATASYELQIASALADVDSSESLTIVVSGLPAGASLSAGFDSGDGTWTLQEGDLSGLILTTDQTVNEDFDLSVTAVATEDDGDTATALTSVHVDVDGVEDSSVNLSGSSGDDILIGGDGDDFLKGRGGDDELYGGAGDDILLGSSGADTLDGGSGADTMFGSSGKDVLDGGAGDDYLDGGSGNDQLDGGAGDDIIKGGRGDDVITGGAGNDRMEGGEGADTFMFDTESGHDIITDILQQDVLMFEGQEFHMDDLILSENSDGDVVVAFQGVDTSVTLEGVSIDDLDANNDGDPSDGYTISDDGSGVTITIDSTG